MRKLPIPQSYKPAVPDEPTDLRVIAVKPAGSDIAREPQDSFAALAAAAPHLAAVLCQLIDELDGLAYRSRDDGLLPLAGEPLWNQMPWAWPDADAHGRPKPDGVAEWLHYVARDPQELWGGLAVTTDQGNWRFGDRRPVRTIR